jgi:hypothetical protein
MLRINLSPVIAATLLSFITFSFPGVLAATPDLAEVCYQATQEPPALKITDRIIGYCTTAITAAQTPEARANLLNDRAVLHLKTNNRVSARADLDEALRVHPGSWAARVTLSHLHWLENNLAAADEVLTEGVPGEAPPQLLINRSIVRRTRGDTAGAVRDAMQLAGYDAESINRLAPELAPAELPPPATDEAPPEAALVNPEESAPDGIDPEDDDINRD